MFLSLAASNILDDRIISSKSFYHFTSFTKSFLMTETIIWNSIFFYCYYFLPRLKINTVMTRECSRTLWEFLCWPVHFYLTRHYLILLTLLPLKKTRMSRIHSLLMPPRRLLKLGPIQWKAELSPKELYFEVSLRLWSQGFEMQGK